MDDGTEVRQTRRCEEAIRIAARVRGGAAARGRTGDASTLVAVSGKAGRATCDSPSGARGREGANRGTVGRRQPLRRSFAHSH